ADSGSARDDSPRRARDSRTSLAGSPRGSIHPTCERLRRSSRSCGRGRAPRRDFRSGPPASVKPATEPSPAATMASAKRCATLANRLAPMIGDSRGSRLADPDSWGWGARTMDAAYFSGLAALAGSIIGGLTSLGATWLTQHSQLGAQRVARNLER